jgi:hypothetical protein
MGSRTGLDVLEKKKMPGRVPRRFQPVDVAKVFYYQVNVQNFSYFALELHFLALFLRI